MLASFLAGLAITPGSDPRRAALAVVGSFSLPVVAFLAARWITPEVEVAFRIPYSTALAALAPLALAGFAALVLESLRRLEPAGTRPVGAVIGGAALVVYALAAAGRVTAHPALAWATVGAATLGLVVFTGRGASVARRAGVLALLALAVARLFLHDGNLVLLALWAAGVWTLGLGLRGAFARSPLGGLVTFLAAEVAFWFLQGHGYRLNTFDTNAAFAFARGEVVLLLAFLAIALQHAVAPAIALAAFALGRSGEDREEPRDDRLPALVAWLYAARVGLGFLTVPIFDREGWTFLYLAHYLLFESIEMLSAVVAAAWLFLRRPGEARGEAGLAGSREAGRRAAASHPGGRLPA
ncbi:MAG: hypothetical protein R3F20_17795 [Planctomycetota bacterium]